jgi:TRAP-type C4-dicarboxylate transport system substrate-binding protein
MKFRGRRLAAIVMLVAIVAAGCTGGAKGGDKAGGGGEPLVFRMANASAWDTELIFDPAVEYFVQRVRELSGGRIRIDVVDRWGDFSPDAEQQVVRAVSTGAVDLGWSGTRVFDTLGINSFQALTAPMLIESYALEEAVVKSGITEEMLKSLSKLGVTGLAVLADGLRKPIAVKQPLLAPGDWRGITFQSFRSRGQAAAIRALGAQPTDLLGPVFDQGLQDGQIQGFDKNLLVLQINGVHRWAPYVTANVNLWPQMDVLLANPARLASLTEKERGWFHQAANEAASRSTGLIDHDGQIVADVCQSGARFANASEADLAALRQAFVPVYASLQQDALTSDFISRIESLKQSSAARAPLAIPLECTGPAPTTQVAVQNAAASALNGIYRFTLTKKDALEHGTANDKSPEGLAHFPAVTTVILKDGKWENETGDTGTYQVDGDRFVFDWRGVPGFGYAMTFTFSADKKGNLRLTPVLPMEPGDVFVWSTEVWTKIG